jgi:ribosomal protein L19E
MAKIISDISSGLVTRALDDTLEDAEEISEVQEIKIKRRGPGKIYDQKQTFPNEESARQALSERYQNNL